MVTDKEGERWMRKLIVFDIDGTLRDEVLGIPESIPFVLRQLKRKGHEAAICTGRSLGTVQDDVLELGIENLITGGGSYISHKDVSVFETALDADAAAGVFQYLTDPCTDGVGGVLEGRDEIFMNQAAADILNQMNLEKSKKLTLRQREKFFKNEKIMYQDNIEEFHPGQVDIHKICLWCSPPVYRRIGEMLGAGRTELAQQGSWNEYGYYEIIPHGAGKGAAVVRLCEYLGIGIQDTLAFGDGRNDIEMLKICGTGIAMANGADELLASADSICGKPMDDGIYVELVKRGLIPRSSLRGI